MVMLSICNWYYRNRLRHKSKALTNAIQMEIKGKDKLLTKKRSSNQQSEQWNFTS